MGDDELVQERGATGGVEERRREGNERLGGGGGGGGGGEAEQGEVDKGVVGCRCGCKHEAMSARAVRRSESAQAAAGEKLTSDREPLPR